MQGFISANGIFLYKSKLRPQGIYKFSRFTLVPVRAMYRVFDKKSCVIFTDQTTMIEVENGVYLDSEQFRTRDYTNLSLIAYQNGE
ncbi:unnamed protein product [Cochlearia groenlandica]